jgi:endo-1,4-beta-xylanase
MKKSNFNTLLRNILLLLVLLVFTGRTNAQLAKGQSKFLGNIGGSYIFSDFSTWWNQITPENGGKWGSVEGTRDVMSWSNMDLVYNSAKTKGIPVKFHTLVWGNQQPSWITSLTTDQQLAQVEEWFKLTAARYPNLDMIDVVNEPLPGHAPPSYKNALGGDGTTGWDWVIKSFELARYYFPKAKLLINEYNILNTGTNVQTYSQIINLLKTRDLIDGIGCQGHFLESTSAATVRTNLNTLALLGLPIYITEFDLNLADDTQQLNKYKELFPVIWEHSAIKGVTLWGYRQGSIWRTDAYLIKSDGTERPALTWLKSYFASTGTSPERNPDIAVWPNPAVNVLNISGAQNQTLEMYDVSGKLVYGCRIHDSRQTIDISSLSRGILLCKLTSGNTGKTWKILRQ